MSDKIVVEIAKVRLDGGTQSRAELNASLIAEYQESVENGVWLPPIKLVFDGSNYWCWDGFHRLMANQNAGLTSINAEVEQGTQRDAILRSLGANSDHGLRRTNADKRRAVMLALNDPEWSQWSDREIARRCNVSPMLVGELRSSSTVSSYSERKTGDGRIMNTSNIGKPAPTAQSVKRLTTFTYYPGMKADCRVCEFNGLPHIHDNWTPAREGRSWLCPNGHLIADDLMVIVEDELSNPSCDLSFHAGDWRDGLIADRWYPLNRQLKIIVDEPYLTGNALHRHFPWGMTKKTWQKEYGNAIRQSNEFADFRLIHPRDLENPEHGKPPVPPITVNWWTENGWHYSGARRALCKRCEKQQPGRDPFMFWNATETPGIWQCPICHARRSDAIMIIEPYQIKKAALSEPITPPVPIEEDDQELDIVQGDTFLSEGDDDYDIDAEVTAVDRQLAALGSALTQDQESVITHARSLMLNLVNYYLQLQEDLSLAHDQLKELGVAENDIERATI